MPITARLSRKFYDKLGDDVANELVEWLNTVDTSYRQEFRDLQADFGRVEAQLRSLDARVDTRLEALKAELLKWMFLFWLGTVGTVIALKTL